MRFPVVVCKFQLLFLTLCMIVFSDNTLAKELVIVNQPGFAVNLEEPNSHFSSHPIFGSLACPSITRLNLMDRRSEPFLVESVAIEENGKKWVFIPKKTLRWWSGSNITPEDFESFIENSIPTLTGDLRSAGIPLPKFRVYLKGQQIMVSWAQEPQFGPYIFNRIPLSRKNNAGQLRFECAGPYRIEKKGSKITLVKNIPKENKHTRQFQTIRILSATNMKQHQHNHSILFRYPSSQSTNPWTRLPDQKLSCERPIDTPLVTTILWNQASKHTENRKFREALDSLIPRKAILTSAAGYMGNLIPTPIMRAHPGYSRNISTPALNFEKGLKLLQNLGYRKQNASGPLLDPEGKNVRLTIHSARNSSGIIEKILSDAFEAAGIALRFDHSHFNKTTMSGSLTGFYMPWPDNDWLPILGTGRAELTTITAANENQKLSTLLTQYSASTTFEKPDFSSLIKIHELVYQQRVFSVLLQHRLCLEKTGLGSNKTAVYIRNPDWFYNLVSYKDID